MRFVISMNDVEGAWDALDAATQEKVLAAHRAFRADLEREGVFVDGLHLAPPRDAITVERDAAGGFSQRAGMRVEGGEHLGGLYVIDVPDAAAAAAAAWARRGRFVPGTNVVRRVFDD